MEIADNLSETSLGAKPEEDDSDEEALEDVAVDDDEDGELDDEDMEAEEELKESEKASKKEAVNGQAADDVSGLEPSA